MANMQFRVHETSGIHACSYKKILLGFFSPYILLPDESYISFDPISHYIVPQNSALILLWLLVHHFCFAGGFSEALNLPLNWEGGQLVSKLPLASAAPSSRSWHAVPS